MSYSKIITLKKMIYQAVIAGTSAGITAAINYIQPLTTDTSFTVFGILLIALKAGENYIKHFNK